MSDTVAIQDARRRPRLKLPAMYTLIRVRPVGAPRFEWSGFIYDISATGMRFELDAAVEPGTRLEIRALLPGTQHVTFQATGTVVRIHDDDNLPGPTRMGLVFDEFRSDDDRLRLDDYLVRSGVRAA